MVVEIRPLKVNDNAAILDAIRADASLDYQRRIPSATQAGVSATVNELHKYRAHWNEFIDVLVNRIGMVIARNTNWSNPLAEFKRGLLSFGDTIEEVQVGLLKSHVYDPDREYMEKDLFGTERPEVQSNFHRVNRQEFYKVTVNEALLKRAFLESTGLSQFVTQLLDAPSTSDQWDEFLLMCSLFAEYESNGGFHHVNVPRVSDIESDAADARLALRKMRAMAGNLKFVSTKYNAARMPTFAKQDELCLFVTPEFNAAIDVEALAGAFHVNKAEMHGRVIEIPRERFGITGCEAIMTVRDFFVIADQALETTSQWNPAALQTNYFLHHWQVISASRFVPAVMFGDIADDEEIILTHVTASVQTPTIEAIDGVVPTNVERGGMIALVSKAVTTPTGGPETVAWSLTGGTSSQTYITATGVLHIGKDETATSVTVKASSTHVNPDNPRDDAKSATLAVNIVGGQLDGWPLQGQLAGIEIDGNAVANVAPGTTTYAITIPAGSVVTTDTVKVFTHGPADADVSIAAGVDPIDWVVTIKIDPGEGVPVNYTVNVTIP